MELNESTLFKLDVLFETGRAVFNKKIADKLDSQERIAASGGKFIYTGNPEDTFFRSLGPVKGEAIHKDDVDHRAEKLGLDPDFVERNMAIRSPDGSGYTLDRGKLAGFMSRAYPDEVKFSNTNGKPSRLLAQSAAMGIPTAILGAVKGGAALGPAGAVLGGGLGLGIGAVGGGALNTWGQRTIYKQGQNLYDRMAKKNFVDRKR